MSVVGLKFLIEASRLIRDSYLNKDISFRNIINTNLNSKCCGFKFTYLY